MRGALRAGEGGGVTAVDLFAGGAAGWDLAARDLGIDPLGIESDDAACATREATGLRTLQADVSALDPRDFACELLLGSPPCQAWSMAGKGGGRRDREHVWACTHELAAGNDTRAHHRRKCEDERSMLVVEPLRFALELRPRLIALEQVEPVLGYWTLVASLLEGVGYSTWAGVLSSETFGVPQTRRRAILMASLDGPVSPPRPTHRRYVAPLREREQDGLFNGGPRERIVHPDDRDLLPWVSMAEALGWEGIEQTQRNGSSGEYGDRDGERSAFTIGRNVNCWKPRISAPTPCGPRLARSATWVYRNGTRPNAAERSVDAPAPAVHFGPTLNDVSWVEERPSTTVAGDPRIGRPGHKDRDEGEAQFERGAVRVSLEEAAVLQGFSPDHPFRGSRTKQFEQIGNAICPPMAAAVLGALMETRGEEM
jgi:DNA (cytosine-5)-methyltransferase 1